MNELTNFSLIFLAGFCAYAGINHFSIGWRQADARVNLLFAALCLLMTPFALSLVQLFQAGTVNDYALALKWNLAIISLFLAIFPWFIAAYAEIRQEWVLRGFSILFALLFVLNLMQPYSMQFDQIQSVEWRTLPWNGKLSHPVGDISAWFKLAIVALFSLFAFTFHVLYRLYQHRRQRATLVMMFAIGLYLASAIEGVLARFSVIDFIPLGPFGFLGMVIVMSLELNRSRRQSLARMKTVLDHVPAVIYMKDPDGRYLFVNRHYEELFHVTDSGMLGKLDQNIFPWEQAQLLRANDMKVLASAKAQEFEETADIDGSPRIYTSLKFPIRRDDGMLYAVCGISIDITEHKQAQEALHRSEMRYQALFEYANDAIFVLREERFVDCNTKTLEMFGCSRSEIIGKTPMDFSPDWQPDGRSSLEKAQGKILAAYRGKAQRFEWVHTHLDGTPFDVEVSLSPVFLDYEQYLLAIVRDISERKQAEAQIHRMAYQDSLTGLASRVRLQEYIFDQIESGRSDRQGAMLILDLDHFKTINDALGHDVGDELLRVIARLLDECAAGKALVARLGGDEFAVLLETHAPDPEGVEQEARALAHRILEKLSCPLMVGERVLAVSASVGAALFPTHGATERDILRHADLALYHAKNLGRNNIQFYRPGFQAAVDDRLRLEEGLRRAVGEGKLELHFQPQLRSSGDMMGAEVLLRWRHPELGYIPPSTFIPVAEQSGLIHAIGAWVFEESCRRLEEWLRSGVSFHGHLSINVSPWQFARPDFVDNLLGFVHKCKVPPSRIMLEVTESGLLYELQDTIEKLNRLRKEAFSVALDDFGTGYSSLSYLKDLPLDLIKIDKSFVDELSHSHEHPLIETIIDIGRHMKLEVIAEGVESESQRDILANLGCHNFQGYLYSRPLPEKDFLAWLEQKRNR